MKLTKLHIFIIILLVLILCPTLGACSVQEGYVNRYPDTSSSSSTGSSDSSGQQYSRQFSNYSKFDHALDKTTMENNPVYVSSYNTGYSPPKNTSSQMSGTGNTATGSGSGSSKGFLAWLKSLF
jgi:RNA recognition motif-containing protein